MADNYERRVAAVLARLNQHARAEKSIAFSASDTALLARRYRELECLAENRKLLAETQAINPTLSSLRARERAGQEV